MNQEILKKLNDLKRIGGITKEEILQGVEIMFPRDAILNCPCGSFPLLSKIIHSGPETEYYKVRCCFKSCEELTSSYFETEAKSIRKWNQLVEDKKKVKKVQQRIAQNVIGTGIPVKNLTPLQESAYLNLAMLANSVINVPLDDSLHEVDDKK